MVNVLFFFFIIDVKQGCDKHFGCSEARLGMSLLVWVVLVSPSWILHLLSVDIRYASGQAPML